MDRSPLRSSLWCDFLRNVLPAKLTTWVGRLRYRETEGRCVETRLPAPPGNEAAWPEEPSPRNPLRPLMAGHVCKTVRLCGLAPESEMERVSVHLVCPRR